MLRSAALAALATVMGTQALVQVGQFAFVGGVLPTIPALRPAAIGASSGSSLPRQAEEETAELSDEEKAEKRREKRRLRALTQRKNKRAREKAYTLGINLDGDKLDNLQDWYEEALAGTGGVPKNMGPGKYVNDLLLRSFFGEFDKNGRHIKNTASRAYTGAFGKPCLTDYETAYETLKKNIREGIYWGRDDGQGWTWLVAGQNPGGLFLYTTREVPFGERPLALIKTNNPDEFFDKADWNRVFIRLHKWQLWGGPVYRFPYPMGKKTLAKIQ